MRGESEDELVRWLRRRAEGRRPRLLGDDAAPLPAGGPWALTVDCQIAGVHFPPGLDPELVARRLLAVNLSDLAAVGARPRWALLALCAPPGFDHRRFLRALLAAARRHRVALAGGDLARSPTLTAVLTLVGERGRRWVGRGGAAAGDRIWVGGTLGESAAGRLLLARGARAAGRRVELAVGFSGGRALRAAARRAVRRHLAPVPQLALGRWLAGRRRGAAIDVSDGFARDLHRLCRESAVGARVDREALPESPLLARLAAELATTGRELALFGGEDYVLLFTLPAGESPPPRFGCHAVGEIVRGRALRLIDGRRSRVLPDRGWDHLAGDG